jgi:hypothetical protein
LTGAEIASRLPVMSAEAIEPASPGIALRIRWSMASRMFSTRVAARSRNPGSDGGVVILMALVAKPIAPICWK